MSGRHYSKPTAKAQKLARWCQWQRSTSFACPRLCDFGVDFFKGHVGDSCIGGGLRSLLHGFKDIIGLVERPRSIFGEEVPRLFCSNYILATAFTAQSSGNEICFNWMADEYFSNKALIDERNSSFHFWGFGYKFRTARNAAQRERSSFFSTSSIFAGIAEKIL